MFEPPRSDVCTLPRVAPVWFHCSPRGCEGLGRAAGRLVVLPPWIGQMQRI